MDEFLEDDDPGEEISRRIAESSKRHSAWRDERARCWAFYAGHQWTKEDMDILDDQGRPYVTFNRIAPLADSIIGFQELNPQQIRFEPRGLEDGGVAELLNKVVDWMNEHADAASEESAAFADTVIGGMGWTSSRMEYDVDPKGQYTVEAFPACDARWDWTARKKNLTDTRWRARIRRFDKPGLIAEFGREQAQKIIDANKTDGDLGDTDSVGDGDSYSPDDWGYESSSGEFAIAQYQEWHHVNVYRVGNPLTNQVEELDEATWGKVGARVKAMGLRYMQTKVRRYRQLFISGKMIWDETEIPYFTLNAMTGKYDETRGRWYGVVRPLIDPQRWNNKLYSEMSHILSSNAKGGVIVETDAVDNVHRFEDTWASTDSVTWVRPGALAGGKIDLKPQTEYPASLDKLLMHSIQAIGDVSALTPEFIGAANREQAGVLEVERKKAALVVLGGIFASVKRYRKEQGKILLNMVKDYVADEHIQKVAGEMAAQLIPMLRTDDVLRYDVVVDTAPESPNQKQEVWSVLQNLLPPLLSAGVPVPPTLVKYLPLPESVTTEWAQYIEQSMQPKEPSPVEQATLQGLLAEAEKAKANALKAQADAQKALTQAQNETASTATEAAERQSKIALNQASAADKAADVEQKSDNLALERAALAVILGGNNGAI